jgi:hypothetical protein
VLREGSNGVNHGFLFDISSGNETIIALANSWDTLTPVAINGSGQVVGFVYNSNVTLGSAGFVWDAVNRTCLLNGSGWLDHQSRDGD